ncbi:cytochrome c oxidase subunit II [Halomicrobium salinisoli]|uniref:cytochrome c oxidase subunit II n=1 Tax=Halomicrobium salinisoli TaxID=2878391 RepID=UPI001CEFBE0A|nr:cytochrome c oxidase subunit II [Halomicrobium salinisoli]
MGVVVPNHVVAIPLHAGDVRTPEAVFERIFTVFLVLGALVGVVVVAYTVYNAYAYRDGSGNGDGAGVDRPEPGELPTGGGGGKKLFLSFGISAIIVLSLIGWTYTTLLYIEQGPDDRQAQENAIEVDVEGFQFGWRFTYPNGQTNSTLTVPVNRMVVLNVTSTDVFHNFGAPELRVKTDAVPGQHTRTWFVARETGTYRAQCYELCGTGHSYMNADIRVVQQDRFRTWYDGNASDGGEAA